MTAGEVLALVSVWDRALGLAGRLVELATAEPALRLDPIPDEGHAALEARRRALDGTEE